MTNSGLAWHGRHNKLIEYCHDYNERVRAIKRKKLLNEIPTRLRLFQLLPESVFLPDDVIRIKAEWKKAYDEYQKTDNEWKNAQDEWQKAYDKQEKLEFELRKALLDNVEFFENLHAELCGCTEWDGEQIVFPG